MMSRVRVYTERSGDWIRALAPEFPEVTQVFGITKTSAIGELVVALRAHIYALRAAGKAVPRSDDSPPAGMLGDWDHTAI